MPTYAAPGVYVEEKLSGAAPIAGAGTSTAGFLGIFAADLTSVTIPRPVKGYNPSGKNPPSTINLEDEDAVEQLVNRSLDSSISEVEVEVNQLPRGTLLNSKTVDALKNIATEGKLKQEIKALGEVEPSKLTAGDVLLQSVKGSTSASLKLSLNEGHTIADEAEKNRIVEALTDQKNSLIKIQRVVPSVGNKPANAASDATKTAFETKVANLDTLKNLTLETPITFESIQTITVGIPDSQPLDTKLARALVAKLTKNGTKEVTVKVDSPYEAIPVDLNRINVQQTTLCTNFNEFKKLIFKDFEAAFAAKGLPSNGFPVVNPTDKFSDQNRLSYFMHAVYGFFNNGGTRCYIKLTTQAKLEEALQEFDAIDEIAVVAVPGYGHDPTTRSTITSHCTNGANQGNFYRFAIFDSEPGEPPDERLTAPPNTDYAAFYYPWIKVADPATKVMNPQGDGLLLVPPSGHIAGIYARVDNLRGVHKAPANEVVFGALGVERNISKVQQQGLNPKGINCIRDLNGNIRVWGARTIGGEANGEFMYISTRRLFLYLRHSIDKATQWTVFEPNNPELWAKIRRNVTAFLTTTWQSGALFGATPEEAFYVKCDAENNPPSVRDLGQVVIEIGVAVTKPAEFVIFRISQWTGSGT